MGSGEPATIRIREGDEDRLRVELPHSAERVARIKTIPGRRRHPDLGYWTIPRSSGAPSRLAELFAPDRLEFLAEPAAAAVDREVPPHPEESRVLARLSERIRARHLSPRTEEAYSGWSRRFLRAQAGRSVAELGEARMA